MTLDHNSDRCFCPIDLTQLLVFSQRVKVRTGSAPQGVPVALLASLWDRYWGQKSISFCTFSGKDLNGLEPRVAPSFSPQLIHSISVFKHRKVWNFNIVISVLRFGNFVDTGVNISIAPCMTYEPQPYGFDILMWSNRPGTLLASIVPPDVDLL